MKTMKNIFLTLFFLFIGHLAVHAQVGGLSRSLENPRGEVRWNFLNTIAIGSVEVGYEQFLNTDQSIGVEIHVNDRFGYRSEGDGRTFSATSFLASYNFYFPSTREGRIYVSPFFKYRFGEFVQNIDGVSGVTNLNCAYLGVMSGYKWNFNNLAFGPFVAVARGFAPEVNRRFQSIEVKAGFNIGYRF